MDRPAELPAIGAWLEGRLGDLLRDLESLVSVDCGSYTPEGVNRVAGWTADFLERLGAQVSREPDPDGRLGDTIVGRFDGAGAGRALLLAHLDTVFDPGTATERPFRIDGRRALGPGVCDMKVGLLAGLYALAALRAAASGEVPPTWGPGGPLAAARPASGRLEWLPFERLVFVANPDEEIGSPVSTPIIARLARETDACFVLESARANGDIVSARKGNVTLRAQVVGRAAHAGVEPEKGRSAILEAAHQVVALAALNGRWAGVTLNVGVIGGGTRPNVVPDLTTYEIDVRSPTRPAMEAAEAELRAIVARPTIAHTTTTIEEVSRHWPMEKLPHSERLVAHAVAVAERLGFPLRDASTGGASDGNTTAGLGVPTLDGLGPIGGLDHSPGEYVEVDSIVPRTTLLAGLLLAVAGDPSFRRVAEGSGVTAARAAHVDQPSHHGCRR
jgi:glutamate carboxypeptidase